MKLRQVEAAFERVWQQALSAGDDMDVEVDDEDVAQLDPAAALQHLQNGASCISPVVAATCPVNLLLPAFGSVLQHSLFVSTCIACLACRLHG